MGCDIHSVAIDPRGKPIEGGKWADGKSANADSEMAYLYHDEGEPFGNRHYGLFAFLAGVLNYSGIRPLAEPRGLPNDLREHVTDDGKWLGDQ